MSTLVFRTNSQASTNHCQECGGEEYEDNTGMLTNYLVVDVEESAGEFNKASARNYDLCEECARRLANA